MIAFYYGVTGFAAVWFYRRTLTHSARDLVMRGVLPFLGGLMLLGAFVVSAYNYADPEYGNTAIGGVGGVFVVGIGALLLGVVLMFVWQAMAPAFFRGETLPRRGAHDLVLAGVPTEAVTVRLPDSGLPEIVIAPDLSNLPEGATAVDAETGEEFRRPPVD
jgi:hypothetical protein